MTFRIRRSHIATGWTLAALAAASAILAPPAWAGTLGGDPSPTYEQLLRDLARTPLLQEAEALVDAAAARGRQAAVRPNPVLSLDVENIQGGGPFRGFDSAETTLGLSQDLELWGRRSARIGAARAEESTAGVRREQVRVEAAARLALVYAEAEAAERRMTLAREALDLALEDARSALSLVENGREPYLTAIRADNEAAAARAALDEAGAEREAAFARLSAVAMTDAPVTAIADSLLERTPAPAAGWAGVAPGVRAAESELASAERRVAVEQTLSRPDVTASVGLRRHEADDATAVTVGLSLPLPLFDRNRGAVDAARAEQRAAQARVAAARQEAEADRRAAAARLEASASRVWAADQRVRSAEEAYRLSRLGFDAGRLSQLELRTARSELVAARQGALDARHARVRAEVERARLEGRAPFGANF